MRMMLGAGMVASALLAAPLAAPASAQVVIAASKAYKVVAPGGSVSVAFFGSLNPDCSSRGHYDIKLLSAPRGGQVYVTRSPEYANFVPTNVRAVCDRSRHLAEHIMYRANPDFSGVDVFDVEVVSPDHDARKYRLAVKVE